MSFSILTDLDWLAVLVATVAFFALGGLWYSTLLFGKIWSRAVGLDMAGDEKPPVTIYLMPLLTCFVSSLALAMLANATGTDTVGEALALGVVAGLGLAAMALLVTGFFDPKKPQPMTWVAVTAGYHLLGLIVVSLIVALWP
ncbi:DUF1761 domain-containing protein [Actinokineospora xionganensis]|uniref:DUF1761 domain-containing protein n=1 Tax=Actinokineospora xionganensis TaxID=2684470 RepID=A0ABR7L3T7_9PSEU|nr:DUF1761 domain-containing protein [Actinokineospora xionganensis]MBC6447347.1 DUF1761 domain-containing protein [Actinokineospora xionganensis]